MIMNNFPWLFENPFELISVQTKLPEQYRNKQKITKYFWWRCLSNQPQSAALLGVDSFVARATAPCAWCWIISQLYALSVRAHCGSLLGSQWQTMTNAIRSITKIRATCPSESSSVGDAQNLVSWWCRYLLTASASMFWEMEWPTLRNDCLHQTCPSSQ